MKAEQISNRSFYSLCSQNLNLFLTLLLSLFIYTNTSAQTLVGSGHTYTTLKSAFDAINNGTLTGDIVLQITSSLTETAMASLNASGSGSANYTSVTIYPTGAGGYTISGAITASNALILLNGADNVTIDGRVNQTGTTKSLTIENTTNATDNGTSTLRLDNTANNNTIQYVTLKGSASGGLSGNTPTCGVIFITTTGSNASTGNLFTYCDITKSGSNRPYCGFASAIYHKNTITYCNFYDIIFSKSPFSTKPRVICIQSSMTATTDGWIISNNSFYETGDISLTYASAHIISIYANNVSANHLIQNNYIGGKAPQCGGSAMRITSIDDFRGIYFYGSVSGVGALITGNQIANMDIACSYSFAAIEIEQGKVDVTNNTIGSRTGTDNIILRNTTTTLTSSAIKLFYGGDKSVSGNTIGAITAGYSASNQHDLFGMQVGSVNSSYNTLIFSNTITNLKNEGTVTTNLTKGIYFSGSTQVSTSAVYNNFIYGLSCTASQTIVGIDIDNTLTTGGGTGVIRNFYNNIISLGYGENDNCNIWGIYENGFAERTNNIYFNTVYISGSPNGNTYTMALYIFGSTGAVRNIRNNIFVNARSRTGGTGKHYGAYFANTTGLTVDYNDYYAAGTGGTLGYYSGDKTSLPIVTGKDANSKNVDPVFPLTIDAGGTDPNDYKSTNIGLQGAGVTISGYTTDYTGYTRPSPPSIGAIENDNPLPVGLLSFSAVIKGRNIKLKWVTSYEINNSGFYVERNLNGGLWEVLGFVKGKGTIKSPSNYEFENNNLNSGKYSYRLKQTDFNGNFEYFELNNAVEVGIPSKLALGQNHPNPFNPATKIDFELPGDGNVKITVYDVLGRAIKSVLNEFRKAGYYTVILNLSNLSSGTYFYRLETNNGKSMVTKKMIKVQ